MVYTHINYKELILGRKTMSYKHNNNQNGLRSFVDEQLLGERDFSLRPELPRNRFPLLPVEKKVGMFDHKIDWTRGGGGGMFCIIILDKKPIILGRIDDDKRKILSNFLNTNDVISMVGLWMPYEWNVCIIKNVFFLTKIGDIYNFDNIAKKITLVKIIEKCVDIVCDHDEALFLTSGGEVCRYFYDKILHKWQLVKINNCFNNERVIKIRGGIGKKHIYKYSEDCSNFLIMTERYKIYDYYPEDKSVCMKKMTEEITDFLVCDEDKFLLSQWGYIYHYKLLSSTPRIIKPNKNGEIFLSLHPIDSEKFMIITNLGYIYLYDIVNNIKKIKYFAGKNIKIKQIFYAEGSIIFVDDKRRLYGFGDNCYQQLGPGPKGHTAIVTLPYAPTPLYKLQKTKYESISRFRKNLLNNTKHLDTKIIL